MALKEKAPKFRGFAGKHVTANGTLSWVSEVRTDQHVQAGQATTNLGAIRLAIQKAAERAAGQNCELPLAA